MPRPHIFPILFAAVAALVPVLPGGRAPAAQFVPLGDIPGGLFESMATGVSDGGNVVAGNGKSFRSGVFTEGFSWTDRRGVLARGDIRGGEFASAISDLSASGELFVGIGSTDDGNRALLFTSEGIESLGDLPGGASSSSARGISADGSVVVGSSTSALGIEAYRWTRDEGMVPLGELPGGNFYSSAAAISRDHSIIVGQSSSLVGDQAALWTAPGEIVPLGDLPGGITASSALDVSGDGSVIVGYGRADLGPQAFRWTVEDEMVGLGWLDEASPWSEGKAITLDGRTIVGFSGVGSAQQAFLWTEETGMRSLQDLLVQDYGLGPALSGWRLLSANDISADGSFIVGSGTNPAGDPEAWLVRFVDFLTGDYNANGLVEQSDLDLVLTNWGKRGFPPPGGWLQDPPIGVVDQEELDKVLVGWGSTLEASHAVGQALPEGNSAVILLVSAGIWVCLRGPPQSGTTANSGQFLTICSCNNKKSLQPAQSMLS